MFLYIKSFIWIYTLVSTEQSVIANMKFLTIMFVAVLIAAVYAAPLSNEDNSLSSEEVAKAINSLVDVLKQKMSQFPVIQVHQA